MNVIVTCPRRFEEEAGAEAVRMLEKAGIGARAEPSGMPGILVLHADSDPVGAVAAMAGAVADEPWSARYVQRAIPVQACVPAREDQIVGAAVRLAGAIKDGAAYRVTVKKRRTQLSARSIIAGIAGALDGKVSLESPERVVLVEILGAEAGVSVIRPGDVLRTALAKMSEDC